MSHSTVSEGLAELASGVKDACRELLENHAAIQHEPPREFGGELQQMPWGTSRAGVRGIIVGSSYWKKLSAEGVQAQTKALSGYRKFADIARTLLKGQPEDVLNQFVEHDKLVLAAIQQEGWTCRDTPLHVLKEVYKALDAQQALIANLYDDSDGSAVVVPDTNALLYNPALEEWTFEDVSRFTVILLPIVLSELDKVKNTHREDFRKKVEGLIKRIKGYRGRGKLNEGVTLRRDVSSLRSIATEPDMTETLPWLVATNDDDRLLASLLEVMRQHPRSAVLLVTRDVNMQNKAEMVNVRFVEPPEPKDTMP